MDVLELLSSVNKIGLLAFLVTFGFLAYEIYQLRKNKKDAVQPTVPVFKEGQYMTPTQSPISAPKMVKPPPTNKNIAIILIAMAIIGVFSVILFGLMRNTPSSSSSTSSGVIPTGSMINSKGILLFDGDFNPLVPTDFQKIKPGEIIYIGVESPQPSDVDLARIRVNSAEWNDSHVTNQFDKNYNVFYIKYEVATSEAQLRIDAQLHSPQDGWFASK